MTLQNRVRPDGAILAERYRGTMMGNRGILHDGARKLGAARWKHRNWVCCVLQFKNRRRVPMTPGTYTELFFLDEATAFAAGHRPCAECRRADYLRWCAAWTRAFGTREAAAAMDVRLHAARALPGARSLRSDEVAADMLPNGAMYRRDDTTWLRWGDAAHAWSPDGYDPPSPLPGGRVQALTNPITRAVLAAGYAPAPHPTLTPSH